MKQKIRSFIYIVRLGILLIPSFYLLDYFVYYPFRYKLLIIRLFLSLFFLAVSFLTSRINEKYYDTVIFGTTWMTAFSLSLMCFITGDGFASPYYAGILQVIIATALLYYLSPRKYSVLMIGIAVQHFFIQFFIPWNISDFLLNFMALGVFLVVAVLVHNLIYGLVMENMELKEFIPICANCKKIRNDDGFWQQLEVYMSKHKGLEFSHGICPECMKELYPEIADKEETEQ